MTAGQQSRAAAAAAGPQRMELGEAEDPGGGDDIAANSWDLLQEDASGRLVATDLSIRQRERRRAPQQADGESARTLSLPLVPAG